MGLRLRNITRQISLKNINPVARVVSVVKPTAQKVIETKNIGVKDIVAISPVGLASNLVKSGTSTITDVVMDKPIVPEPAVDSFVDTTTKPEPTKPEPIKNTPAIATPVVKKKPNTLMYAGIGVGVLVLGYFGYKMFKK
jgi:hypothetical protein